MQKITFFWWLVALSFGACTHTINIQVMKPAEITVPGHLKKIGVINRSVVTYKQDNKDKVFNILEGILSGESIGGDRGASEECLNGFFSIVTQQGRIQYQRLPNMGGTGTGLEKKNLTWEEVDKVCKENNLNGLLVLESFDSDNTMRIIPGMVKVKNPEGVMVDVPQFTADARLRVTSSWRVYDAEKRIIFDEIRNFNERGFTGVGPTERDAVMRLPNKLAMLNQTGYAAGAQFGQRISPNWIWVDRYVYKGKGDEMKFAYRLSKSMNWEKAAQVWNRVAGSPNQTKKNMARACYNMAVICEVDGKLDLAIDWASQSYEKYGFRPALDYKRILLRRVNDEARLKVQLGE